MLKEIIIKSRNYLPEKGEDHPSLTPPVPPRYNFVSLTDKETKKRRCDYCGGFVVAELDFRGIFRFHCMGCARYAEVKKKGGGGQ